MSYRKLYVSNCHQAEAIEDLVKASNKETMGKLSRTISSLELADGKNGLLVEFYDDQPVSHYNGENGKGALVLRTKDSIDLVVQDQADSAKISLQKEEKIIERLKHNTGSYSRQLIQDLAKEYDESSVFVEQLASYVLEEKKRHEKEKRKHNQKK